MSQYWFLKRPKDLGNQVEDKAANYLKTQGCSVVCRNFAWHRGEIDIIAEQNKTLLFIEVRYRSNNNYGGALQSLTLNKQKKITLTAQYFLQKHPAHQNLSCRFDLVSAYLDNNKKLHFHWLKDAFRT